MTMVLASIALSVLMSWGWSEVTTDDDPICTVDVVQQGQTIHVPHKCSEVLEVNE